MGKPAKPTDAPRSDRTPEPAPAEDDEVEDGDIATPKQDDDGDDDEPL